MADNRLTRGTALVGGVQVGTTTEVRGITGGTVSVDLPSISAATTGSATVTITGVADGDIVMMNPPALTAGLAFVGCAVTSANTVTVYALNTTAAPINQAAADFDYLWFDLT